MTLPTWWLLSGFQVGEAVANTVHLDLFNTSESASTLKIFAIIPVVDMSTEVLGFGSKWEIWKTTNIGSGGTAYTLNATSAVPTIVTQDSANADLSAHITARNKPTGGAASGRFLGTYVLHTDETNVASQISSSALNADWARGSLVSAATGQFLTLRPNEGIKIIQVSPSTELNVGWKIGFTVE
jgi:hypothetical protein